jgi:hypothetical protein
LSFFRFLSGTGWEPSLFFTAAILVEPWVLEAMSATYHFVSIAFSCIAF